MRALLQRLRDTQSRHAIFVRARGIVRFVFDPKLRHARAPRKLE